MTAYNYDFPGTWWKQLVLQKLGYVIKGVDGLISYMQAFGRARKIWITAGELFPRFYNNERFLKNLSNSAINNKAEIKIIFGPALYIKSDMFLKLALNNDNVELYARAEREREHFKLIEDVDGNRFVFADEPHDLLADKRKSFLLTEDYAETINKFEKLFIEKLETVTPVDKTTLVDTFSKARSESQPVKKIFKGFIYQTDHQVASATDEQIVELKKKLGA
jgi:hypothetical protein